MDFAAVAHAIFDRRLAEWDEEARRDAIDRIASIVCDLNDARNLLIVGGRERGKRASDALMDASHAALRVALDLAGRRFERVADGHGAQGCSATGSMARPHETPSGGACRCGIDHDDPPVVALGPDGSRRLVDDGNGKLVAEGALSEARSAAEVLAAFSMQCVAALRNAHNAIQREAWQEGPSIEEAASALQQQIDAPTAPLDRVAGAFRTVEKWRRG